jgi:hypothetical protein
MRRWVLALAAIGFSQTAVAAELEFLRGSANPAYTVPQIAPPTPDDPALRLNPPASYAQPIAIVQPVAVVPPLVWNWTGFYVGAHAALAVSATNFADPFGVSVFGDRVRSLGFSGGGQIGYNWQPAGCGGGHNLAF